MDRTRLPAVRVIVELVIGKFRLVKEVAFSLSTFGKFFLLVGNGRMAGDEIRGPGDRRIKDGLEIFYYFQCPARKGLAAGQTVPDFSLGAVRLDGVISEGKRGLELGGDEFRYGSVGRESAIMSESLDQGGGGEVSEIQKLQLVKKTGFPSEQTRCTFRASS